MSTAKPYLTTDDLLEEIKSNISFPFNQSTFTEADIIKFLNKELLVSQVPSVLEYHENYLTHEVHVPLRSGVQKYAIPNRAIGMKLNDVWYEDEQGNEREMTLINDNDRAFFQDNSLINTSHQHKYYIQGNYVVLVTTVEDSAVGDIVFSIFLRPNQLVANDRAATIETFNKKVTISNTDISAGDTITILDQVFTADSDFVIGGTSTITATNLVTAINNAGIDATATNNATAIVNIAFETLSDVSEVETSNETGFVISDLITIVFDEIGDHFEQGLKVDFLQTNPGHQIYKFDVIPDSISGNEMNFDEDDVPDDLEVGDYVCLAHECIIPGIPPELHHVLVERVSARVLSSIGDQQGLSAVKESLREMEQSQGTLIDNRVENSPRKILNRNSPLRLGKMRPFRKRI